MSPRLDINSSSSADRTVVLVKFLLPQSMPTYLSSHSPCNLLCDALRAESDTSLSLGRCIVDSFRRLWLPIPQPLSVLILAGTSLSSRCTPMCLLHSLWSENRLYGNPVLSIHKEHQASPTHNQGKGVHFLLPHLLLNYLSWPNWSCNSSPRLAKAFNESGGLFCWITSQRWLILAKLASVHLWVKLCLSWLEVLTSDHWDFIGELCQEAELHRDLQCSFAKIMSMAVLKECSQVKKGLWLFEIH